MNFAHYGRKSTFSEKSDSIDNQFRMAREHAESRFQGEIDSFTHYYDEDFTGANTNRPDLQRLLDDIRHGLIDVLIVYQLDRFSRDIKDFANMYSILEENKVNFISIKENIDTTTPIGKAMMYVTVVFAQMERETIAGRVKDNMIGLAKKGYWTGGNPPKGYVRENIVIDGKKHVTIRPDDDSIPYIMDIFDTFLENNFSLQSMETYYKNNSIRTPSGAFFSTTQLHKILTMPYCVEATPEVYDFYSEKGCNMDLDSPRDSWDGSCGVMIYGRTTEVNKKHQLNPPEKWIVCKGIHKPFMSAEKWLMVQTKLKGNNFNKTMKYEVPLLKGILRCSCGSIMQVSRKKKKDGVSSWYYCLKRMRQGEEYCNSHHIKVDVLDNKIIELFNSIKTDPTLINKYAATIETKKIDLNYIKRKISTCENKISMLTQNLSVTNNSSAAKYIISEIEKLDDELTKLKREYSSALSIEKRIHESERKSKERYVEIQKMIEDMDSFSDVERNNIAKKIISSCVWDGSTLHITL